MLNKWRENNPEKRKEQTKRYREKEISHIKIK